MPAKTPRASGQERPVKPPKSAKFVADALADNIRAYRDLNRLEQADVAERMQRLGHPWRRVTVSEVERGRRNVTVPELLALVLVLGTTAGELLDPRPDQRGGPGIMFLARTPDAVNFPISSEHLTGLMCRHTFDIDPAEFHANGIISHNLRRVEPS